MDVWEQEGEARCLLRGKIDRHQSVQEGPEIKLSMIAATLAAVVLGLSVGEVVESLGISGRHLLVFVLCFCQAEGDQ